MLTQLIEERRSSPSLHQDMLGCLLRTDEGSKAKLTDEQIIDLIIALIYSGYETVSTTSMMAIKYLYDHPKAIEELRARTILEINFFFILQISGFSFVADQLLNDFRRNIWRSEKGSCLMMHLTGLITSL